MNIRFFNTRLLTLKKDLAITEGELWVRGNTIVFAGTPKEAGTFAENSPHLAKDWDREVNGNGNLLMPGFKNAHTHSGMTFLRSVADDLPLHEWLNQIIFPRERKISEEDIYYFSKLAILEYLTSGITAIGDMYLAPDAMAAAAKEYGFRTILIGAVNNFTHSVRQAEEWYIKYRHEDLISYQLGFHAEYTTDKEILEGMAELSGRYKASVSFHIAETHREVLECREKKGCGPLVYLDNLGLLNYGGCAYHGIYLDEEDMDILKNRKLSVVTNPGSNTKLASGIADISCLLEKGINVAIGTDGPASNNCLDMFREMFLVSGLAKLKSMDASSIDANDVLRMATLGGAEALRLKDCDILSAGKKADLIMIDLQQPNMQPLHNIAKNIVYSGSKVNIKMTMVNGEILYENGDFFVGEDISALYDKINTLIKKC